MKKNKAEPKKKKKKKTEEEKDVKWGVEKKVEKDNWNNIVRCWNI